MNTLPTSTPDSRITEQRALKLPQPICLSQDHRARLAALALLTPLAGFCATTTSAAEIGTPMLETRGDDLIVREGYAASPAERSADASRAAAGEVIGATPSFLTLFRRSTARLGDAWIADIGTLLRGDADGDGFFTSVELTIDADTDRSSQEVYASITLSDSDGYQTLAYNTAVFAIHGRADSDAYRVEIDLLDNHEADWRDVHIALRDAYDDSWLDEVSAATHSSLANLPLEAVNLDAGWADDDHGDAPQVHDGSTTAVLVSVSSQDETTPGGTITHHDDSYVAGYAAAGTPWGLGLLAGLLFARRTARRR